MGIAVGHIIQITMHAKLASNHMTTEYHTEVEDEHEVLDDSDVFYEAQSFDANEDDPEIGHVGDNQENTLDGQVTNGA